MTKKIPLSALDQATFDAMKQIGDRKCNDCGKSKGGSDFQIRKIRRRKPIEGSAFHFYHSKICNSCEYKQKRINANLAKAKAEGRINPDATITAEELIEVTRPAAYDYNPQLAQQTGRYGNARVWIKGVGFLGAGAVAGQAAAGAVVDPNAKIAQMQQEIDAMKAGTVDAFPG